MTLNVGLFINAVIQFLIVAFAIFWVVKLLSAFQRKEAVAPTVPPEPTRSEVLLEDIRNALVQRPAARTE